MFKRKCKVVLVRHGSTIYSDQGRLYDTEEYPPINQKGKTQMEILTKMLLNTTPHIDKIYTSSALRAIQSARILSKGYDIDYEIIDELYERKTGIWGGLTFEQIEEKYPDMLKQYHENPYEYWPEGGESTRELRKRVDDAITTLVKQNEYKNILIVTHEGVVQSAVASTLGVSPDAQGKIIVPTGSATQINYFAEWSTLAYCSNLPYFN